MPSIRIFIGSELRYILDRDTVGGVNYSTNPSRLSAMGAHHLSITERTGGKHYDFFVKTVAECKAILRSLIHSAQHQEVTLFLDADCNSPAELARFPH